MMSKKLEKILAVVLFLGIILSAYFSITLKPKEHYTEFFILNDKGKAGEYPNKLTPEQNATIIAGIVNHEQEKAKYLIQVNLDEAKILEKSIELEDEEKMMQNITFKPSRTGKQKLELRLFKDQSSQPYSLHLYLEVNP